MKSLRKKYVNLTTTKKEEDIIIIKYRSINQTNLNMHSLLNAQSYDVDVNIDKRSLNLR